MAENDLLTPREAADRLRISTRSLQRYHALGEGPPVRRVGRRLLRYARAELDAWMTGTPAATIK